jgi:3-deoxy-D-manno-octulosonic-acid transferase
MFYNLLLFVFFLFYIPKALYEYIFLKKKKKDLLKRLGLKKYFFNPKDKTPIIWIHAVSVGEIKSSISLVDKLKKKYPNSYIIISSVTQTGFNQAKQSLFSANKIIFFPFDFSYSIKKVFSQIQPNIIIFIETDLWPNFIKEAKKNSAKVIIVSAKISKKSVNRLSKFPYISKRIFSNIDLILCQNDLYKKRFSKFTSKEKLFISGNLKFANIIKKYPKEVLDFWKNKINPQNLNLITIACTHHPEEELIVQQLKDISNIKLLIAPRHPEKFNFVYKKLKKITSISFLSNINQKNKVVLIDQMGILNILYQISTLAIIGGSFINKVGGHNILESVFANTFVFFGPYMHTQMELKKIVLKYNCGQETQLKNLKKATLNYLENNSHKTQTNCLQIINNYQNVLETTFLKIKKII